MVNLAVLQGIFLLIIGCFANNIFLELIIKIDPGCGPALTFCQFAFMVITLLPSNVNKSLKTPLWFYFILTAMFFTVSFLNNLAFDYQISQPVHMVGLLSELTESPGFKVKFVGCELFHWFGVFWTEVRQTSTPFYRSCHRWNFGYSKRRGWFKVKKATGHTTNGLWVYRSVSKLDLVAQVIGIEQGATFWSSP